MDNVPRDNIDHNRYSVDEIVEEYEFKYNFINKPWDDRTKKNKAGIILLLLGIFFGTMACIVNGLYMHFISLRNATLNRPQEVNCEMVKMEDYTFAGRIHLVSSNEMLCIGALVSATAVLVVGAASKSGPVRLFLGNPNDQYCKQGFTVDLIEPLEHYGVLSKKMNLMSSYENIAQCVQNVIKIGTNELKKNSRAYVIGRTMHIEMSFSRQPVVIIDRGCPCSGMPSDSANKTNLFICVRRVARCPILIGDLLVQDDKLYGLASTSIRRKEQTQSVCFADLSYVAAQLSEKEVNIVGTSKQPHGAAYH